jgi:hypothetical protein
MKLLYPPAYSIGKTLEIGLPGYICFYPAEQACKGIAQNEQKFDQLLANTVLSRHQLN